MTLHRTHSSSSSSLRIGVDALLLLMLLLFCNGGETDRGEEEVPNDFLSLSGNREPELSLLGTSDERRRGLTTGGGATFSSPCSWGVGPLRSPLRMISLLIPDNATDFAVRMVWSLAENKDFAGMTEDKGAAAPSVAALLAVKEDCSCSHISKNAP